MCCPIRLDIALILAACLSAVGQEISFQDIHVDKKPGRVTGVARVSANGKVRRITSRALQAWPVMEGKNALVLVLETKAKAKPDVHLRFYEGLTRKWRDLGAEPLSSAGLLERKQSDGNQVFVLTGTADEMSVIVVAGLSGAHGLIEGASAPKLQGDSMTFTTRSGENKTLPVKALLATDLTGIYQAGPAQAGRHVQFLRDGTAVVTEADGRFESGRWRTDGEKMIVTGGDGLRSEWLQSSLVPVTGVPAGTRLSVRLLQALASESVKAGDPVRGVLISPATISNAILIPQGSELSGTITQAYGVGWAVKHETAALTLEFTSIRLPDGTSLPVHTQLHQVENSREAVTSQGKIQGIRSTGTPGHSAESKIASVAALDPVAYLFTTAAATAALGFAEPEILYPAGTELIVEFTSPVITSKSYPRTVPEFRGSEADQAKLSKMVRDLPFRTMTKGTHKPSDLTNLAFVGSPEGLRRAFHAAGWIAVDQLTAESTFMTLKTVGGNQVYNQAPMSMLLLDERPPVFTLTKTTDTFSSRHHLRVFDPAMKYDGATVLTSSSTQDIGIAFSAKHKTFIHVIDEYIDNERSKVVNDLEFTGCVEAMDLVPRPWAPQDAYNSTGDKLKTDGAIAVMRIGDCNDPRTTPVEAAEKPALFKRVTRDTLLTVRNDVYRGNLVYQGIAGARWARNYLATKDQLKPDTGAWRKTDESGALFKGVGNIPRERQSSEKITSAEAASAEAAEAAEEADKAGRADHRWDPPRYEIGVQGGYLRYPATRREQFNYSATPLDTTDPSLKPVLVIIANQFDGGWTAGAFVKLNTWKWFSNQFSYNYQRGKYVYFFYDSDLGPIPEVGRSGLVTRQFDYNLLWNLRPPRSRWRPYLAGGPTFMLTSLSEATIKKAAGPFRLGLQNVGLLLAAFETGSTPPLDGGGIFSAGIQYGGGIAYRIRPRITLSGDFRETLSKNPQFVSDSYTKQYFINEGFSGSVTRSGLDARFRQQRITLGVAFTF